MIIAKKLITDSTDSNGQVNYRYDSTGVGDVVFGATFNDENSSYIRFEEDSSFLTKTYSIQDCYKYDATEHSQSFSSSTASQEVITGLSWDNTNDWSCSFDLKVSANAKRIDIVPPSESLNHHLGIGLATKVAIYVGKAGSGETSHQIDKTFNTNTYYSIEVSKVGSTVTFKFNDETVYTESLTWLGNYSNEGMKYTSWSTSGTIYIKNIKIKPL